MNGDEIAKEDRIKCELYNKFDRDYQGMHEKYSVDYWGAARRFVEPNLRKAMMPKVIEEPKPSESGRFKAVVGGLKVVGAGLVGIVKRNK